MLPLSFIIALFMTLPTISSPLPQPSHRFNEYRTHVSGAKVGPGSKFTMGPPTFPSQSFAQWKPYGWLARTLRRISQAFPRHPRRRFLWSPLSGTAAEFAFMANGQEARHTELDVDQFAN